MCIITSGHWLVFENSNSIANGQPNYENAQSKSGLFCIIVLEQSLSHILHTGRDEERKRGASVRGEGCVEGGIDRGERERRKGEER